MNIKPLNCPFCGSAPEILPKDPAREGGVWGEVACVNDVCPAKPSVKDGSLFELGSSNAHKDLAIFRWNIRA